MRPNVYVCVCVGGGVIHNLLGTLKRLLKGRGAKFWIGGALNTCYGPETAKYQLLKTG